MGPQTCKHPFFCMAKRNLRKLCQAWMCSMFSLMRASAHRPGWPDIYGASNSVAVNLLTLLVCLHFSSQMLVLAILNQAEGDEVGEKEHCQALPRFLAAAFNVVDALLRRSGCWSLIAAAAAAGSTARHKHHSKASPPPSAFLPFLFPSFTILKTASAGVLAPWKGLYPITLSVMSKLITSSRSSSSHTTTSLIVN